MSDKLEMFPFFLYEGMMQNKQQVGDIPGYIIYEVALANAQTIANHDKVPVMIHDVFGSMVTTVIPQI